MPYKTIKETCVLTGTTESALRYYDEKGILSPKMKNESGRREWLYDDESIRQLELIMLYRSVGISVEEIKMISEKTGSRSEMLEKRLNELKGEREKLNRQITMTEVLMLVEGITSENDMDENRTRLLNELIKHNREENEK